MLLGFVGYEIKQRCIVIVELFVSNAFRCQGIGTDLLEYVEGRAVSCGKLYTETVVNETGAVGWLKKKGYIGMGLRKGAFGDRDGVWFRKMV